MVALPARLSLSNFPEPTRIWNIGTERRPLVVEPGPPPDIHYLPATDGYYLGIPQLVGGPLDLQLAEKMLHEGEELDITSGATPSTSRVVYRGGGGPGYFIAEPIALAIDLAGGCAWAMPVAPGVDGQRQIDPFSLPQPSVLTEAHTDSSSAAPP